MRVFLLALVLVIPTVAADWPSFHGDPQNTGAASGTDYAVFEDVWWNLQFGEEGQTVRVQASPIVKDGVVVVGDWAGTVHALDAESGAELWSLVVGERISAAAAIEGSSVFVVSESGTLKKIDLRSGDELKSVTVGATLSAPTVNKGKLYIGNEAGEMKAFDTQTLTLDWSIKVSDVKEVSQTSEAGVTTCTQPHPVGQIRGAPAVYEENVIFGSLNDYVYAVDAEGNSDKTTNVQWVFKTGGDVWTAPAIATVVDRVIVGSDDGSVYALDPSPSGQGFDECFGKVHSSSWRFKVQGDNPVGVHSSPAVDGSRAYFGASDNAVYAVQLSTGSQVWSYTTGDVVLSSPAVANGLVVAGSNDDKVYWLDADDGAVAKTYRAADSVESSPAIDGDRMFIASFDGSVYMFGPQIPVRPDLEVASILGDASGVTIIVRNAGDGEAAASTVRIDIDGAFAAEVEVPVLAAGATHNARHPVALAVGAHTVKAVVDFDEAVVESDEADNQLESSVTIVAPTSSKDGGGLDIPGPELVALLGAVALAFAVRRR